MKNDSLRSEFVIFSVLTILFCSYLIWIRTITETAIFFLCFLILCLGKIIFNKIGYVALLPKLFAKPYFMAFISLITFCIAYITSDIRLGADKGWFGWWDQSQYLQMAQDLSNFRLVANHYMYGLGYPILGALFYKIYPTNPFLIPNLLLYILVVVIYFKIYLKYLSSELSVLTICLMMWGTQLTEYIMVPWNNSVSIVGTGILIYLASVVREIRLVHAIILGIMLGWVFAARYVDVVFLLPIVAYICIRETSKSWKNLRYILVAACIGFVFLYVVLYSHQYAFGSFMKTPYHLHFHPISGHSDQSLAAFSLSRIPDHLYSTIINPYQFHDLKYWKLNTPLLGYSFFFIFALAGFSYSVFYKRDWVIIVIFFSLVVSFAFYGSFASTRASDLKYNCLRYFSLWYPILSLMGILAFFKLLKINRLLKRERHAIIIGIITFFLLVGLNYLFLLISSYKLKSKMINSSEWKVYSNYRMEFAKNAIDKNIATRWDTGRPQRPGMYFLVDLGVTHELSMVRLRLHNSGNDYPRGLNIEVSIDGVAWQNVLTIKAISPPILTDDDLELNLSAVKARYVKLIQTSSSKSYFWSIHEFEIYKM